MLSPVLRGGYLLLSDCEVKDRVGSPVNFDFTIAQPRSTGESNAHRPALSYAGISVQRSEKMHAFELPAERNKRTTAAQ